MKKGRGTGKRPKVEDDDMGVAVVRMHDKPTLKEKIAKSAAANCRSQHSEIIFRLIQSFEAEGPPQGHLEIGRAAVLDTRQPLETIDTH